MSSLFDEYKKIAEAEQQLAQMREQLDQVARASYAHATKRPELITVGATPTSSPPVRIEDMPRVDLVSMFDRGDLELVDVNENAILVVEAPSHAIHQMAEPDTVDIQMGLELGRTGASRWGSFMREEYNPELIGRLGLQKYDRMRRSDVSVRSAARIFKTPIVGATWYVQPYDDTEASKREARLIGRMLYDFPSNLWVQMLWEALLMFDFGYYMFEKVYDFREVDGERLVVYKKLAPRHPLDVVEWQFDANGGPAGVEMYDERTVVIPIHKLAVFTFDGEGGNITGISGYRSAYKHWYFKENLYKIDAIQKERHGIGIPVIKLPPGFSNDDKKLANELGQNLRTNEKAHVVLPPMWEITFAELGGNPVDALESAKHHTEMIFQNVLAQAMYADAEGDSLGMMDLFYKSLRHVSDLTRGVFNKYCIPYLVLANWGHDRYPELKVRRLGDTAEARTISFALRNMVGSNIVEVDEPLETWAREVMDAPAKDATTVREAPTPQFPGGGAPRQAQARNQRGKPGAAAGDDRSGS